MGIDPILAVWKTADHTCCLTVHVLSLDERHSTLVCLPCQAFCLEVVTGFEPANIWFAISFLPIRTHYHKLAEDWGLDPQTLAGSTGLANRSSSQLINLPFWIGRRWRNRAPALSDHIAFQASIRTIWYHLLNWRRVGGIDPLAFRLQLLSRQC